MTDRILRSPQLRRFAAVATLLLAAALPAHAVPVVGQGTWQTTLQPRDIDADGHADAYYDTQLGISWLVNAYEEGPPPGMPPGRPILLWSDAQSWVSQFEIGGVADWRLPTVQATPFATGLSRTCPSPTFDGGTSGLCGYNVDPSLSELAHLYYLTLGNLSAVDASGAPLADGGLSNTGPFANLRAENYWTGSMNLPTRFRWTFSMADGSQNAGDPYSPIARGTWAVHDGAVGVAMVPEPATALLALLGLGWIGLTVRRRQQPSRE